MFAGAEEDMSLARLPIISMACVAALLALRVAAAPAPAPGAAMNKLCPVMTDQPAKDEIFVDYAGRHVHFCCNNCLKRFRNEPERFIANLDGAASSSVTAPPTTAPVAGAPVASEATPP